MRNLLQTVQGSDVVQCVNRGRQTAVQTEDLHWKICRLHVHVQVYNMHVYTCSMLY